MNVNKYISVSFDWTDTKNTSWDNQWKGLIEILWNAGLPFLAGILFLTVSHYFILMFMIPAWLTLRIRRNTKK